MKLRALVLGTLLTAMFGGLASGASHPDQTIDVIVLSRHQPLRVRLLEGACRLASGRLRGAIRTLAANEERVQACNKTCVDLKEVKLSCASALVLKAPELPARTYGRSLIARAQSGRLRLIATVPVERYIEGVVRSELAAAPQAARRAQAIVARTYAQYAIEHPRHDDAPVCDLTHCQVFRTVLPKKDPQLKTTQGQVLVDAEGQTSPVFYHSTCGGETIAANRVWPRLSSGALRGVKDVRPNGTPWCAQSPHYRWRFETTSQRLSRALSPLTKRAMHGPSLSLTALDSQGLRWRLEDHRERVEVSGVRLHRHLGKRLGWGRIKSFRFQAERAAGRMILRGHGLGHGVGLCQEGAKARAAAGQTTQEILKAYFPGLKRSKPRASTPARSAPPAPKSP